MKVVIAYYGIKTKSGMAPVDVSSKIITVSIICVLKNLEEKKPRSIPWKFLEIELSYNNGD